jgi:hypothetical protein
MVSKEQYKQWTMKRFGMSEAQFEEAFAIGERIGMPIGIVLVSVYCLIEDGARKFVKILKF